MPPAMSMGEEARTKGCLRSRLNRKGERRSVFSFRTRPRQGRTELVQRVAGADHHWLVRADAEETQDDIVEPGPKDSRTTLKVAARRTPGSACSSFEAAGRV